MIASILDPFFNEKPNAWSEVVTDYVIGFEKGATDVHYRIIASKPNIGRIASLENTNSAKLLCEFYLGPFLHFLYMPIKLKTLLHCFLTMHKDQRCL